MAIALRLIPLAGVALLSIGAAPPDDGSHYLLTTADGTVIGRIEATSIATPQGRVRTSEQVVTLDTAGEITRITERRTTTEDTAGRVVSSSQETRTGQTWARSEARIGSARADFTVTNRLGGRTVSLPLPANVRFDSGAGLLAEWVKNPTERLEFDNLSLDSMAIDRVTIEKIGDGATPGAIEAIRVRGASDLDRDAEFRGIARLTIDRAGRILRTVQPMFGMTATMVATSKANALKPRPPFRLLDQSIVKAPFRIGSEALQGKIRYSFSFKDGLAMPLPDTGEQMRRSGVGAVTLDICGGCGPGLRSDAAYLAAARQPTHWMESDHPRLLAIAAPVAAMAISDARKMELLRSRAEPYIKKVSFAGHFTALQTLQRKSGDCTEAAVLLAALGRAAGIPTKVANGLVYSRAYYHKISNAFMPHSWTLAYVDGRWKSFDLALEAFDSSHIALTVGDGDARSMAASSQLAGLLEWQNVAEVRSRPGAAPGKN
ncbi:MAG: transglutaminase-like domain-containing protein [Sphingomicrobium sp.]